MASSVVNSIRVYLGDSEDIFTLFGVAAALYIALKSLCSLLSGLRTYFLASTPNFKKHGAWAVVTGATDGIGKAYAEQLAHQGMDIVLISRSPEKLSDVAMEIESKYNVKTKIVAADFSKTDIYDKIKSEISHLDIGVLVNNVGMGYAHPEYFAELDDNLLFNLLNVNMTSAVMMTKIVLPGLAEKRKGVIINVSSASALRPSPLLTVYSSSKIFLDFFSRGLQVEYASKGVIIQSVTPFFVATKLSKIRKASFFAPSPSSFVRSALKTVGVTDRTLGCLSHSIQKFIVLSLPEWMTTKIVFSIKKMIRKKYLTKINKIQ